MNHVHIKYPHVTIGISDKELNWKPEGITEGIKSAFECSKKDGVLSLKESAEWFWMSFSIIESLHACVIFCFVCVRM